MRQAPPRLIRIVSHVNAATCFLGIAIALSAGVFPLKLISLGPDHWSPHHRDLAIVDRTGDPAWSAAIAAGVVTWDRAGADLRLTVTKEPGPCRQERDHIEICEESEQAISVKGLPGEQGFVRTRVARGHELLSVVSEVCSDCWIPPDRRTVIATHEIGHALGLVHSADPDSVMSPMGGSAEPDAQDYALLRSLEPKPGPGTVTARGH